MNDRLEDAKYDSERFKKEKTSLSDEEKGSKKMKLGVENNERQSESWYVWKGKKEGGEGMEGSAKEPGSIKLLFQRWVYCTKYKDYRLVIRACVTSR